MIKREFYLNKIRPYYGQDVIKVITGLRHSGKTELLKQIEQELIETGVNPRQIITFNFEQLYQTTTADLCNAKVLYEEIIERAKGVEGKITLFLDEIQEVKDWQKCLALLQRELDCDIYLAGSNARLSFDRLEADLQGQAVCFTLYPFSFSEFIELYHKTLPQADRTECFKAYLLLGGIPFLSSLGFEKEPCHLYLKELYDVIVYKDMKEAGRIRQARLLDRIIFYLADHPGRAFSATSISKALKEQGLKSSISVETTQNYLRAAMEAGFLYSVKREDLKAGKILGVKEKYYLADHGIGQALTGTEGQKLDSILENIVYMELIRRGYQVNTGKIGHQQIDFIARKDKEKLYIQVASYLESQESIEKEFGIYQALADNYPKYVLSLDESDFSQDGIKHRNIKDFLLDETWSQPER